MCVQIFEDKIQSFKKNFLYLLLIPATLSFFVFFLAYGAWNIDWSAPFNYGWSDALVHGSSVKRAMEGKLNIWVDDHLGFPYGLKQYAFPHLPWATVFWGYFCGIFTSNYAFVLNSYFLLSFCATTVIFAWAARKLGVRYWFSLLGGLLYSFWQFHSLHGMGHLTASSYYAVPMIAWICINLCTKDEKTLVKNEIITIGLAVFLITVSDMFYAFWGCMLLFISALYCVFNKKYRNLKLALIVIGLIVLLTFLLLLPAILYGIIRKPQTANRLASEAYYWGIKFPSLFIPNKEGHPLFLLKEKYIKNALPAGENLYNYIGVFGIFGLVYLVIVNFKKRNEKFERQKINVISNLNTWTLLIGVSGGLGLVVAFLLTTKVRVYNRISVYVYCFSLFGFILFLDNFLKEKHMSKNFSIALWIVLLLFHLTDMQFFPFFKKSTIWPYNKGQTELYHKDVQCAQYLEKELGSGSKILYLPYINFPENVTETGSGNYTRGVITSMFAKDLYSSFGVIYGTKAASFMESKYGTSNAKTILSFAVADNFDYIMIDTKILNNSDLLIENLKKSLCSEPMLSYDNYTVFKITEDVKEAYAGKGIGFALFDKGFYAIEQDSNNTWRWSNRESEISVVMNDGKKRKAVLTFDLMPLKNEPREIAISGCGIDKKITIENRKAVHLLVDTSYGEKIHFASNVEDRKPSNRDRRDLNFAIFNLKLEPESMWEEYSDVYIINKKIMFGIGGKAKKYFTSGISNPEDGFTWSVGKNGELQLNTGKVSGSKKMTIEFDNIYAPPQRFVAKSSGKILFDEVLNQDTKSISFVVDEEFFKDESFSINFEYPDSISPKERGEGKDGRDLAFAFKSFELMEAK